MQLKLFVNSPHLGASKMRTVPTARGSFVSVGISIAEGESTKWVQVNANDKAALQTRVDSLVRDAQKGEIPVSVRAYVSDDEGKSTAKYSFNYAGGDALAGGIVLVEEVVESTDIKLPAGDQHA